MIMGFFLIRPIPLPAHQGYDIVEDPDEAIRRDNSHDRFLDYDFFKPSHPITFSTMRTQTVKVLHIGAYQKKSNWTLPKRNFPASPGEV